MKLRKVRIKNFRGHKDTTVNFDNLNVIIGKNDIGKSSIIDALDVYFNGGNIDVQDLNVYAAREDDKVIEISCAFDVDTNEQITLDSSDNITTTLQEEYLLNADGMLEISKRFDFSGPKKTYISLIAKHPVNFPQALITLKIADLRRVAIERGIDLSSCNSSIKKDIRKAIFEQTELEFEDSFIIETNTKDTDIINISDKFKDDFPLYLPFRADRTNTDKDKEVNETTKAITKSVTAGLVSQFEVIKRQINDEIRQLADKTLEKLKMFDAAIAQELDPVIESKALDSLFSFTFNCEDGIPFNKRGSGVKRLMLLSFFLAESERDNCTNKNIIYAIEEPETSQHPDFQIMLMNSLKNLSLDARRQIFLTTHTPEIVKMVDKENLIFLQNNTEHSLIVQQGNDIEIKKVAKTLGILPFVSYKGVIFVEGNTDKKFLLNLSKIERFKNIIDLCDYTIIPLHGCGNVDVWIKEDYLRDSNVRCLYFKDRDNAEPITIVQENNVICTRKREIENYFSPASIERYFNIVFTEEERASWDDLDVPQALVLKMQNRLHESVIKEILSASSDFWENVNFSTGAEEEIQEWFNKLRTFFG